jgi:hypothetical protein
VLILGGFLFVLPFIALAVFAIRTIGWRETAAAFALTALFAGCIVAGAYLIDASQSG